MMTYRSSYNPPDKTDYSNFAFKKSEILDILKILNSNFSFDEHLKENDPKSYKDFFYSYDVFNGFEVACLISGYDPNQLSINQTRNAVWRNENPTFVQALGLVLSADKENGLFKYDQDSYSSYEFDYTISNADLKTYLIFKNIIISGFNDKEFTNINDEDLVDNTKLKNTIASLELDVAIEKVNVRELNEEIEKLKKQLQAKDARIKELELLQVESNSDLLSLIFDETTTERYAPDLVSSIMLWEHTYITSPKDDSHSNKADTWLKHNTGYDTAKKAGSASKIREVTAPFIKWSTHRDKAYKK